MLGGGGGGAGGALALSELLYLLKRINSIRKEFAPTGSKFFPFRVAPFQKEFEVPKSKQEVTNVVSLHKSIAGQIYEECWLGLVQNRRKHRHVYQLNYKMD